jgi:hypothetical protein
MFVEEFKGIPRLKSTSFSCAANAAASRLLAHFLPPNFIEGPEPYAIEARLSSFSFHHALSKALLYFSAAHHFLHSSIFDGLDLLALPYFLPYNHQSWRPTPQMLTWMVSSESSAAQNRLQAHICLDIRR